ncbi:ISA1 (YLL027W) [Zygosaccharomyces parabailii]|nr:ISA1 (YLL027W) [Zygosaccharomyces parabailii]CDH12089.1 related to Iron-sulfur assembly protein 1 [Zygosaccharomyces bailii ISA1307]
MIAQCVKSDSMLLVGQSQRMFSRCSILGESGSHHFAPTSRRFLQTSLSEDKSPAPSQWFFKFGQETQRRDFQSHNKQQAQPQDNMRSKWSSYSMPSKQVLKDQEHEQEKREAETSKQLKEAENPARLRRRKSRRQLRPRKALISLSPRALTHLRSLLNQPEPKMIRIGVKNRGCSGLTYDLQYTTKPGKYDEVVEQDGVKVIVDSKALFSVVGSEMDWIDDRLSSRFVFKNPNSKGTCGCGESFMV